MIKLDISTAIFFYLLLSVIGVFLLWIFFDFKTRKSSFTKEDDNVVQCTICANIYIDSHSKDLSKCPQCGSFTRRKHDYGDRDSSRRDMALS